MIVPARFSSAVFIVIATGASAVLVGLVRRLAMAHGVIDRPTERGSHDVPTPRGGGLGIVATVLGAFVIAGGVPRDAVLSACAVGCAAVALVGWLDDRGGMSVLSRLAVHVLAALTVGALAVESIGAELPWLALLLVWAFWTVSSINIVNFMDGINGLIASQMAIFAVSLMSFHHEWAPAALYAAAVAGACVGFLPWNFPRARIFLGDVGSGALGFLVPVLAILAMRDYHVGAIRAQLPLLPIFADAAVTMFRRWRRGERLTQAHRRHLYQRLANGGYGHTRVTLLYAVASLVGAAVAHFGEMDNGWIGPAVYLLAVVTSGALLDRRLRGD